MSEEGYGLVFPFVNVQSKGGIYDDDSYAAGYHMGMIQSVLSENRPPTYDTTIRAIEEQQADLIAMNAGYKLEATPTEFDEWKHATFFRLAVE